MTVVYGELVHPYCLSFTRLVREFHIHFATDLILIMRRVLSSKVFLNADRICLNVIGIFILETP